MHYSARLQRLWLLILVAACVVIATTGASAQECIRIMKQDSTLNNMADPAGYQPARLGTLGKWEKVGTGNKDVILIPGLGFSGEVFTEFMARHVNDFTMYALTLPGFGGTPAPPSPDQSVSFGEQTWTNGALSAIETLIEIQRIESPIIIGHWLTGTQLALQLAIRHPEKVKAVILLSGSAKMMVLDPKIQPYYETPEKRVMAIDKYLAPMWFRTVTRETWDDNNFLPGDYAVNPVRGLRLWREAASPMLHVWVRYLCEFNAQDITVDLDKVRVPVLLLKPNLSGLAADSGNAYMEAFCHSSWGTAIEKNSNFSVVTIPHSRACLWFDQPEACDKAIAEFLSARAKLTSVSSPLGN